MSRPTRSAEQQVRAYQLWKGGMTVSAIHQQLFNEFKEPVSRSMVGNWAQKFKDIAPKGKDQDIPFSWFQMGDYDIPWDDSKLLIDAARFRTTGRPGWTFTMRQAKWYSRVFRATNIDEPKGDDRKAYGALMGYPFFWWFLSHMLSRAEQGREVLGLDIDVTPIETLLEYRPWISKRHLEQYRAAVRSGQAVAVLDENSSLMKGLVKVLATIAPSDWGQRNRPEGPDKKDDSRWTRSNEWLDPFGIFLVSSDSKAKKKAKRGKR